MKGNEIKKILAKRKGRINLLKKNKKNIGLLRITKIPKTFKLGNKQGEGFKAFSKSELNTIRKLKNISEEEIKKRAKLGLVSKIEEKENSDFVLEFEEEPIFKSKLESNTNSLKDFPKERKRLLTLLESEKLFYMAKSKDNDFMIKKFYYPNVKYSNALIDEIKAVEDILKDNGFFNNKVMPFITTI